MRGNRRFCLLCGNNLYWYPKGKCGKQSYILRSYLKTLIIQMWFTSMCPFYFEHDKRWPYIWKKKVEFLCSLPRRPSVPQFLKTGWRIASMEGFLEWFLRWSFILMYSIILMQLWFLASYFTLGYDSKLVYKQKGIQGQVQTSRYVPAM